MRRLLLGLVASTGCTNILGIEDLSDPEVCLGAMNICVEPVAGPLRIESETIDTERDHRCATVAQLDGPDLCVIAARSITFVGTNRFVGKRPLVVFASDTILVTTGAILDVSSQRDMPGAGADSVFCAAGAMPGVDASAGGGAGGSLGGVGGNGGDGTTAGGAPGGTATPAIAAPLSLRGGCAGQAGNFVGPATASPGGSSGGGLGLLAKTSITLQTLAAIRASGGGGAGGAIRGGGGGGGSGGMVVLDAPALALDGTVIAQGGAGGEGGGTMIDGAAGADGPVEYDTFAKGGSGATGNGGNGGDGSARSSAAGRGGAGASGGGGGGGGGGAGIIVVRGTVTGMPAIDPAPM